MKLVVVACAITFLSAGAAEAVDWSKWELENSVAREGDWLVISQPGEGFCYLKQSYNSDPSKMELTTGRSGTPTIIHPFYRGLRGNITYQIDDRKFRVIRASELECCNTIPLPREIIPALKAGRVLTVRVTPVGKTPRAQSFSLMGFTAASRWLDRDICRKR